MTMIDPDELLVNSSEQMVLDERVAMETEDKKNDAVSGAHSCRDLSLSDAQLEKILEHKERFRTAVSTKLPERESFSRRMNELMSKDIVIDRNEVLRLNGVLAKLDAEISAAHLEYRLGVLSELSSEQRRELRHAFLMREAAPASILNLPFDASFSKGLPPFCPPLFGPPAFSATPLLPPFAPPPPPPFGAPPVPPLFGAIPGIPPGAPTLWDSNSFSRHYHQDASKLQKNDKSSEEQKSK